jgi:phosphatidate cytidylyltransferase
LLKAHLLKAPELFADTPAWVIVVAASVINIAGQLGDLLESLIKRGAGVKDSGSMLPGHGGILDRIDALLFAAPVALLIFGATREYFLRLA